MGATKVGIGAAVVGAGVLIGYNTGFIGDKEEGFGSAIRDLNPLRPRSVIVPKQDLSKGMTLSWGTIGLIFLILLLAVALGGVVVYFLVLGMDSSEEEEPVGEFEEMP